MNRFIIVADLPYLYDRGKMFAVKWDENGFTVGTEVDSPTDVPAERLSETEIKAKCAGRLNSIDAAACISVDEPADEADEDAATVEPDFEEMTVAELKAYTKEQGIELGKARTKADIIAAIKAAE